MAYKTMLAVAAAAACVVGLHVSLFATGNSDVLVLSELQFAPAVLDPDDDLAISLRQQAQMAIVELQARSHRE